MHSWAYCLVRAAHKLADCSTTVLEPYKSIAGEMADRFLLQVLEVLQGF